MKNIMVAMLLAGSFMLIGCSNNSKNSEEEQDTVKKVEKSVSQEQTKKIETVKKSEPKKEEKKSEVLTQKVVEQKAQEAIKETKKVVKKAVETAKQTAKVVTKKTKDIVQQTGNNEAVKKITQNVSKKVNEGVKALGGMIPAGFADATQSAPKKTDAKKLYSKCAGCHGQKAEKKALGVSKIVANLSEKEIINALEGYKKGAYGGAMKGVMQTQAKPLSQDDIKALASYITKLK